MNGKEREVSLLRFENRPDGRETRWFSTNDDEIKNEMRGRCVIKENKGGQFVGIQASNGRWLKEGGLWKE